MSFRFRLFLFHSSKGFLKKTNSDIRLFDLDIIREKDRGPSKEKEITHSALAFSELPWPGAVCVKLLQVLC